MSGHSKWSTIKHKKGAEDAKRGKIFTRLGRDIMVAAREGGGSEETNNKLKLAIIKAKSANMPKDNIERAIKRGTGELEGGEMFEVAYEAYGVEGIAFVIEVLTDNKNRTLAQIKTTLNKNNGTLAASGAVTWQFDRKGYIVVSGEGADFDELFMVAAEAGADDVVNEGEMLLVYTPLESFAAVEQAITNAGYKVEESELRWIPNSETEVDKSKALQNLRIQELLEELDDVQSVASNLAVTDEVLAAYEAS
ncbi:MAG: YebC/PmpR family DNA-binding transcriptional regulator [Phototrophicaceae bacterium]